MLSLTEWALYVNIMQILAPKRDRLKTHKYDMQWVLVI